MRVKLVLGGEAVNIPKTDIGLGIAFIRVWVDGNGFTSASNDLGALGYILLETPEVDVGDIDEERKALFSQLHGRVVHYDIKPNIFVKSGGIARIAMTISLQEDGGLSDKKIEFQADSCTGVSLVSNALSFSCEMLQEEKKLADLDNATFVSEADRRDDRRECARDRTGRGGTGLTPRRSSRIAPTAEHGGGALTGIDGIRRRAAMGRAAESCCRRPIADDR